VVGQTQKASLGATLAFMIARYVASDWVAARAGERLAGLMRGVDEEGWRFVAFVRLVPLFPFNLVNYVFGVTRIRLGDYVIASFVCMAPGALAYTYLGYAGREAASGQAGAIHKALLALALLAAVAFLPRLVRRLKGPRFTEMPRIKHLLAFGHMGLAASSCTTKSGPISRWIKILRIFGRRRRSAVSQRFQSLAGCIINNMSGFRF
jgi:hypothetical protein